ncbi:MAG TPA: hypothetical protein VLJ60_07795 [bacterium]|nr:hypothetical protein [bacterium]
MKTGRGRGSDGKGTEGKGTVSGEGSRRVGEIQVANILKNMREKK